MKYFGKLLFAVLFFSTSIRLYAQLPVCASGKVYYIQTGGGGTIYNYDPYQPLSASNPSLNTITAPSTAIALAVGDNLNASSPSPTFYTVVNNYFYYYNGAGWTNTGHTSSSWNIGGGGGFIYSFSNTDTVYKYKGTGNATIVAILSGSYVPDIVASCTGHFYVLKTSTPQTLYEYDSTGTVVSSWLVTGTLGSAIGLAKINDTVYAGSTSLYKGIISGTTVNFSLVGSISNQINDMANCECTVCPGFISAYANNDTLCTHDTLSLDATLFSVSSAATYNWSGPNSFSSSVKHSIIPNISSLHSGTYSLSVSDTGCTYNSSTHIVVDSTPVITISTNSPICKGANLQLTGSSSLTGVQWNWYGPNSFAATIYNPTRNNMQSADSGYYSLTAAINGCSAKDSVFIVVKPLPNTPIVISNSPVCAGDTLKFTLNNPQAGVGYNWTGPSSFSSSLQNPYRSNALTTYSGSYRINATLNGCSDSGSTVVNINPLSGPPIINIYVNPGDTICAGKTASFTSFVSNSGATPVYQWKKNGINISGAINASYSSSSFVNNDIVSCYVQSNAICQPIDTASSNNVKLHVILYSPPTVTISANPANFKQGVPITFSATISNGRCHSFQWRKNGINIPGATTSSYASSSLQAGDKISVFLSNCDACTVPDSAKSNELTMMLGIDELIGQQGNWVIWPNPFTDYLNLENVIGTVKVFDLFGQVVYSCILEKEKTVIDVKDFLPGTYILQITDAAGSRAIKRVVKE